MALNIGSCQYTVQTQKLRTGVEQRDSTNVSKAGLKTGLFF